MYTESGEEAQKQNFKKTSYEGSNEPCAAVPLMQYEEKKEKKAIYRNNVHYSWEE